MLLTIEKKKNCFVGMLLHVSQGAWAFGPGWTLTIEMSFQFKFSKKKILMKPIWRRLIIKEYLNKNTRVGVE